MEINIEKLIHEIHKRPVLWDLTHISYHNRIVVENNWKEIEKELEIPKDNLKKKWKNIRDQFRTECKKLPDIKSEDNGISLEHYQHYIAWPHFKSLIFLKDHMKTRKCLEQSDSDDVNYKPKEKKSKPNDDLFPRMQQKFLLGDRKAKKSTEKDDDMAFFESILPYMRIMEMKEKLKCRMAIQKLVYDHAFGETAHDPDTYL